MQIQFDAQCTVVDSSQFTHAQCPHYKFGSFHITLCVFFSCRRRTQRALNRTFAVVSPSIHGPLVVPHGRLQQLCGVLDMAVFGVPVSVIR